MESNIITLEKFKRIPGKIRRDIRKLPFLQTLSELAYKEAIEKHVNYLPKLGSLDYSFVDTLQKEGACVTSLQALSIPSTSQLIASTEKLLLELRAFPSGMQSTINMPLPKLMNYPDIFLWGLEERLLDIIENYVGLPLLYHGAELRREIANGKIIDVRQWHLDVEDHRMLKIIVYLNDVSLDGGPFEYIPKDLTTLSAQALKYNSGFVSDKVMQTVVSPSDWKPCTGCYGTVILTDTCNVFHRAKAPVVSDRFSITFSYTSIRPIKNYGKVALSKQQLLAITSRLSKRQTKCILGDRNL